MPFAKSDRGVGMRERGTTAFAREVKAGIRAQDNPLFSSKHAKTTVIERRRRACVLLSWHRELR
jgi:hypothetical protein